MNPKIKIIRRWGEYRVGEILAPPASLRKYLFDREVAEYVQEQTPPASVVSALAALVKRGRGRPRKNP